MDQACWNAYRDEARLPWMKQADEMFPVSGIVILDKV
jgi:hypothetical protein